MWILRVIEKLRFSGGLLVREGKDVCEKFEYN